MCQLYPHLEWRNPTTGGVVPFSCNSWRCPECAPIKRHRLENRLAQYAEKLNLRRFLTLTLSPRGITAEKLSRFVIMPDRTPENFDTLPATPLEYAEQLLYQCSGERKQSNRERFTQGSPEERKALQQLYWRYIAYVWNKYRTMLKRKYPGLSYIMMKEPHKDGIRPHLHILINQYIPVNFIKETFPKYGGGSQVYIEYIPEENIKESIKYLSKYLTKMAEAQTSNNYPAGLRRITVSRDINITLSPEDFTQYLEHIDEHGKKIYGNVNEAGEPTYNCIKGFEDEYIDAMEHETCKKCIYRRAGKCKPYQTEWRLYSELIAGGWITHEPTHNDPVYIHNQTMKPLTEEKKLLYDYFPTEGYIPIGTFGGVDDDILIPDILIHDRYHMDGSRPEVQRWTRSKYTTLKEMLLHEHEKQSHRVGRKGNVTR